MRPGFFARAVSPERETEFEFEREFARDARELEREAKRSGFAIDCMGLTG